MCVCVSLPCRSSRSFMETSIKGSGVELLAIGERREVQSIRSLFLSSDENRDDETMGIFVLYPRSVW